MNASPACSMKNSPLYGAVVASLLVALLLCAHSAVASPSIRSKAAKTDEASFHDLECEMRSLALDFARNIQPWRDSEDVLFRELHDALELTTKCGKVPPPTSPKTKPQVSLEEEQDLLEKCTSHEFHCIFVTTNSSDNGEGSLENPIGCLHKALNISRAERRVSRSDKPTKIILRQGIHNLYYRPLILAGDIDSNLEILAYPNEDAWISGGIPLPGESLEWKPYSQNSKVWVADLTNILGDDHDKVPKVPSLFTAGPDHRRYIRARYPNDDPEIHDENRRPTNLPSDMVLEWHKPEPGPIPTFDYFLLDKNDSTMDGYNMYASGHGGVCAEHWGEHADSYWCSNHSEGGWAEVDCEAAMTGKIQLPVGVTWNLSTDPGKYLGRLTNEEVKGAVVFAWHSQTWAMHMFQIKEGGSDKTSSSLNEGLINQFHFEKGGGKQGGRNWCRCDQCTYAGGWCGQHQNPPDNSDTRLIGGLWWVENLLPELDQPGEFWYNHSSRQLFVYPNTTKDGDDSWKGNFRFAMIENIVELWNVSYVAITGVGFRDSTASFMSDWSAPSGGDWSLHRGGTVFLENTTDISIRSSIFRRLDSNAIFLSRRNRNVLIERNTFEWLAENAIATWGETHKYDATNGDQPWNTMIYHNVMRELGIYEKQSSAFGQAKAALSDIQNNIMFNMPRAGINFNDMMGGGDKVIRNLIFNSCRESGDHGPINSWDRQPFLTKHRDGKAPSFNPIPREIIGNFIIANYGADQGVDNDDGSSWFHLAKNVFFMASGFKMDYGGHDSVFEENLVMAIGYKACIGFGSFFAGHGDIVRNNRCLVGLESFGHSTQDLPPSTFREVNGQMFESHQDNVAFVERCKAGNAVMFNNSYYTPHGNASYRCGDLGNDEEFNLTRVQDEFGIEKGSTSETFPSLDILVQWAKSLLIEDNQMQEM